MIKLTRISLNEVTRKKKESLRRKGYVGQSCYKSKVKDFSSIDLNEIILPAWCKALGIDAYWHIINLETTTPGLRVYTPLEYLEDMVRLLGGCGDIVQSEDKLYASWTRNLVVRQF